MIRSKLPYVAVVAAALPLLACGKSKVDQCNAFVDAAHGAQAVVGALNIDADGPAALEAEAAKIDAESKKLAGLELKDEKLVGFRNEYAATLGRLAKNIRDLGAFQAEAKDPEKAAGLEGKAKTLETEGSQIEAEEKRIVDDVNAYCGGK